MNTRQLMMGLVPTPEFEKQHTFGTFRQFPELAKSIHEIDNMKLKSAVGTNPQSHRKLMSRSISHKSTHKLDELSRSVADEVSVMSDFRRILLDNRRKNQPHHVASKPAISSQNSFCSNIIETASMDALAEANAKLTKISISFDSGSTNSYLAGFQGARLNKKDFNIQLRRCLNINLRRIELDTLFARMDDDCSGLIDGVEFIRYFFGLGKEARWAIQMDTLNANNRRLEESKKKAVEEQKKIKEWQASQISQFSEADTESAMQKLSSAAFKWDPSNSIESLFTSGFEAYLSAYEFKLQIDKSFGIRLTGAEIGALIHEFTTREGEFPIDGHLFLKRFGALQKRTWEEHGKLQVVYRRRRQRVLDMGQQDDMMPKMLGR